MNIINRNKKAELSETTVAMIIIFVLILIGLAVIFAKFKGFRELLGI